MPQARPHEYLVDTVATDSENWNEEAASKRPRRQSCHRHSEVDQSDGSNGIQFVPRKSRFHSLFTPKRVLVSIRGEPGVRKKPDVK